MHSLEFLSKIQALYSLRQASTKPEKEYLQGKKQHLGDYNLSTGAHKSQRHLRIVSVGKLHCKADKFPFNPQCCSSMEFKEEKTHKWTWVCFLKLDTVNDNVMHADFSSHVTYI